MSTPSLGLLIPAGCALAFCMSAAAQEASTTSAPERLDAVDHAARMQRIALTGDLGIAPLPPVTKDSPLDDIRFADRLPVNSSYQGECDGLGPPLFSHWITPAQTGTGKGEYFQYMIPSGYDPFGAPVPLVLGYHGYGASANSVAIQSTMDEEAEARGWFFMSPTGLDDQLFGSMECQHHIELALQWMLDTYNIDPDRIYMAGFSMGGGVVANFAARHKDPNDIMVAAVASACGTFDWTLAYDVHPQSVKDLLENPFNFGGPPTEFPFAYQRSSGVYFPVEDYPPTIFNYDIKYSFGSNLFDTPTYVAYDIQDLIFSVRIESQGFINLMAEAGVPPVTQIEDGTLDPCTGALRPHSWAVFDMPAVFAFFDGKVVDRYPSSLGLQIDRDLTVSYLDLTQETTDAFSWVEADATAGLSLSGVENVAVLDVDASLAGPGLAGAGPFAIDDAQAEAAGHSLRLRGFDVPPAYLLDGTSGEYVLGTLSDPADDALVRSVGAEELHVDLVTNAVWTGDMSTTPDPVAVGGVAQLDVDLPASSAAGYLVLGFSEGLVTVKGGNKITAWPFTPSLLLQVPFDGNGDLSLPIPVPNDPGISGAEVFLQAIGLAGPNIDSITNMWVLHIE